MGGNAALLLAAIIWGASFVAQDVGKDHVGAFTYNGLRMLMGVAVLIPLILFMQLKKRKTDTRTKEQKKKEFLSCILLSFFNRVIFNSIPISIRITAVL